MPRKQTEAVPSADWTSLIDIIFQLLIFFMVTLAMGTVEQQASAQMEGEMDESLPELPGMSNLGEALEIGPGVILIHAAYDEDNEVAGDIVTYLFTNEISNIEEAKKDSTHSAGPFSWDKAYKKLQKQLTFARDYNENLPRVEMRAFKGTPYGNVLDIMNLCYHDEPEMRIDQVYFRFARLAREQLGGGS
ncbi:biopolymer transporter ExbD [bacterium]|nr:biopolymer transporter ExbD [bacterium]